jgi:hypothetical protein
MALYSNLSIRPEDRDIISMVEDFYLRSVSENQYYWSEASIDARFESGDQSIWAELYQAPINRRQLFGFNRIRRIINMIDGHQRQNRKSITVVPVENGDEVTAEQFTKILMWINSQEGMLDTVSDSFQSSLISGMSLLQIWIDYSRDPISGDIKIDNCPYNTFVIDPFFKKADLSDCNALWKRSYLSQEQCATLLPEHADEISCLSPRGVSSDGKFQYMPESRNLFSAKLLTYDEFYYRSYRKQRMIIDPQTGEAMEWKSNDDNDLREYLARYPTIVVQEQTVPTVSLAIIVQGNVYHNGPTGMNIDDYPFIPVWAYFRPDLITMADRVQSVVRGLRDAQYLYNRRRLIELDMLESVATTGIIYKEDALVDPKQAFTTGQGRAIAIKQTAQMSDVQQIAPAQIPPSMLEVSKALSDEIQQMTGINEVLVGADDNSKSGIESMLRQRASLSTLQGLFDNLDRSKKILGKRLLAIIQNNFTPGKVKRILEEEPSQEFYNKAFGKYDAVIAAGADTDTQRALALSQMLELRAAGIPIPDDAIMENITLQNKKDVLESMKKTAQQQQQMQEQQMQVQMDEIKTRSELAKAREAEQYALSEERMTRSGLNLASMQERVSEAEKDNMQAKLNYVKALAEIQDLDINSLARLVEIAKMLEEPAQEAEKSASPGM